MLCWSAMSTPGELAQQQRAVPLQRAPAGRRWRARGPVGPAEHPLRPAAGPVAEHRRRAQPGVSLGGGHARGTRPPAGVLRRGGRLSPGSGRARRPEDPGDDQDRQTEESEQARARRSWRSGRRRSRRCSAPGRSRRPARRRRRPCGAAQVTSRSPEPGSNRYAAGPLAVAEVLRELAGDRPQVDLLAGRAVDDACSRGRRRRRRATASGRRRCRRVTLVRLSRRPAPSRRS